MGVDLIHYLLNSQTKDVDQTEDVENTIENDKEKLLLLIYFTKY